MFVDRLQGGLLRDSSTPNPSKTHAYIVERPGASDLLRYERISEALLAVFPSQESVNSIVKIAGPMASFFHQLAYQPYKDIQIGEKEQQEKLTELTTRHTAKTHPLIIVRQMLLLAITFRYIRPEAHRELQAFSEPAGLVMQRVADAAVDLINTNDKMMSTIDGIGCLLLTSSLQSDNGNLRSGWLTTRRAMSIAQMMCLHRQKRPPLRSVQPGNTWDPRFLWYRIVYFDRFFSLILGLPQGSTDSTMGTASPLQDDTPMGRLERRHCVLAGRVLQRNEQDLSSDSLIETQNIDAELRELAESMPSRWWLAPDLASLSDRAQLFWATARLTNQVFHYILLSQLHLPFMLRSSSGSDQHQYEYGRLTCLNASRDLLGRYRMFRTFSHVSYCCHSMDFFALTAAMTLLLAHLDGHCHQRISDNALIHQRISDRAIMEEILDNMEQVGTLNKTKTLGERGAGVLRRLLAVEADAASGSCYRLDTDDADPNDAHALRLSIPHFGVVSITREDQLPADKTTSRRGQEVEHDLAQRARQTVGSRSGPPRAPVGDLSLLGGTRDEADDVATADQSRQGQPDSHQVGEVRSIVTASGVRIAENGNVADCLTEAVGDSAYPRSADLTLTEDQGDWGFQEVDMSLLDSLIRDSEAQAEGDEDFWWLL